MAFPAVSGHLSPSLLPLGPQAGTGSRGTSYSLHVCFFQGGSEESLGAQHLRGLLSPLLSCGVCFCLSVNPKGEEAGMDRGMGLMVCRALELWTQDIPVLGFLLSKHSQTKKAREDHRLHAACSQTPQRPPAAFQAPLLFRVISPAATSSIPVSKSGICFLDPHLLCSPP